MVQHDSQQIEVREIFGFIPVLMVRQAVPADIGGPGSWRWGRWRFACLDARIIINADLRQYWK